jgi:hypothetical protein
MRREGLRGWPRHKRRRGGRLRISPAGVANLLECNVTATEPETMWATDISAFATDEGKLLVCVAVDLDGKPVVG